MIRVVWVLTLTLLVMGRPAAAARRVVSLRSNVDSTCFDINGHPVGCGARVQVSARRNDRLVVGASAPGFRRKEFEHRVIADDEAVDVLFTTFDRIEMPQNGVVPLATIQAVEDAVRRAAREFELDERARQRDTLVVVVDSCFVEPDRIRTALSEIAESAVETVFLEHFRGRRPVRIFRRPRRGDYPEAESARQVTDVYRRARFVISVELRPVSSSSARLMLRLMDYRRGGELRTSSSQLLPEVRPDLLAP